MRRVLRRTGVLALVLGTVVASLGLGVGAGPARAAGTSNLSVLDYDVTAAYDPATTNLRVTCRITFQASGDVRTCHLYLSDRLAVTSVEVDGAKVSCHSGRASEGYAFHFFDCAWTSGQRPVVTVTYEGTPEDYYAPQDRYWSRATEEAVWMTSPWAWLPAPDGGLNWYLRNRVTYTVPADWTVFVPGRQPSAVEEAPASRTYVFDSAREASLLGEWFAGPYTRIAEGEVAEVPYAVWSLPGWEKEAGPMAAEVPKIIGFYGETFGYLNMGPLTIVQVPPEQGGGVVCGDFSGVRGKVVALTPTGGTLEGGWASNVGLEQLWAHEIEHCVAEFGFDEGLADFGCDYYIVREYPDRQMSVVTSRRGYVLETIADHGDLSIVEANAKRNQGQDIPDWHAYCYAKPALVWNMFRGYFGDEKLVALFHLLQDGARVNNFQDLDAWYGFLRDQMVAVGGEAAGAFYDRWYTRAYRLDLAVGDVHCTRPSPGAGRGEWTVSFTVTDLHDAETPPARDTIPWVEVAVSYGSEGGTPGATPVGLSGQAGGSAGETAESGPAMVIERVPLTANKVRAEIRVPGRPLKVTLDPNLWILDYDATNNQAEVRLPLTPAQVALWVGMAAAAGLVAWGVITLVRRRPKALPPPPSVGRAQ